MIFTACFLYEEVMSVRLFEPGNLLKFIKNYWPVKQSLRKKRKKILLL